MRVTIYRVARNVFFWYIRTRLVTSSGRNIGRFSLVGLFLSDSLLSTARDKVYIYIYICISQICRIYLYQKDRRKYFLGKCEELLIMIKCFINCFTNMMMDKKNCTNRLTMKLNNLRNDGCSWIPMNFLHLEDIFFCSNLETNFNSVAYVLYISKLDIPPGISYII